MKRIILCADDYGQNPAISQAIVELLGIKQLSATSCMVTSPVWQDTAKWLIPFKNKADIGLHFNLTEGKPLSSQLPSFFPLKELIMKAQLRKLDKAAIIAELRAQLDQFTDTFGQLPDFIDGHQHIHQFPIIRNAVCEVYETYLRQNNSYIRCTYNPLTLFRFTDVAYVKQLIIQLCGGIAFRSMLVKQKIPHNNTFAGIYEFKASLDYPQLFSHFLQQVKNGGLIMCHPGLHSSDETDEINTARHNEYLYFNSHAVKKALANNHVQIARADRT